VNPILPGAAIGILGGGQLGRMTGMAARTLGYSVNVLDPDPQAPAFGVASLAITAPFDDEIAAARLAEASQVVTLEIEQVSTVTIEAAARFAPTRPGAEAVFIVQERGRQKEFLAKHGFPLGDFRVVSNADECEAAVAALGRSIVKATMGGYDGRGQTRVASPEDGRNAFTTMKAPRCVVEQFLDLEAECSVLVARSAAGETKAYPPSRNHHEAGILVWSVTPSGLPPELEQRARELAMGIADALGIIGLLAVEMFITRDGRLLVNELAPRPHNTYHHSERAVATSQFEQLVRAVCGLPLGDVSVVRPAAIHNLLGDLWEARTPDVCAALTVPRARVHLYGKASARPGRKMGHLSGCGDTPEEALHVVQEAFRRFSGT
jgi:5-(carboxyamino)imidazole ribonucleotide synthase